MLPFKSFWNHCNTFQSIYTLIRSWRSKKKCDFSHRIPLEFSASYRTMFSQVLFRRFINILYRCTKQEWHFCHHLKPPEPIYCLANRANTTTKIANRTRWINFQALRDLIFTLSAKSSKHLLRLPVACCTTETIRTVLSALPDTSSVPVGLNFNVVGGKSWAFNIVKSH